LSSALPRRFSGGFGLFSFLSHLDVAHLECLVPKHPQSTRATLPSRADVVCFISIFHLLLAAKVLRHLLELVFLVLKQQCLDAARKVFSAEAFLPAERVELRFAEEIVAVLADAIESCEDALVVDPLTL